MTAADRGRRPQRGQATLETAFVLIAFVWIAFGALDFSRAFFDYLSVANLAREGARKAAICQNLSTVSTAVANASALTRPTEVAWVPTTTSSFTIGQQVTVKVTAVYEPITPIVGPIIGTQTLSSNASMTVEALNSSC